MPPLASTSYTDPLAKFLISGESPREAPAQAMDPLAAFLLSDSEETPAVPSGTVSRQTALRPEKSGKSSLGAFAKTLARVPENLAAQAIAAFQGQTGASITDRGYLDQFYNWVEGRNKALGEEYEGAGDFIPGVISKRDIAELGPNLAFSGVSMLGTLAGGAAGAVTPVPGATVAGGMAGGAAAAHRMQGYQTMNDWLTRKNEEFIQQFGRPISPEEEARFRETFESLATEAGLWEAGPEAIGNVLELALMVAKGSVPGKVANLLPKGVKGKIVKGITRAAGIGATEEATETITQMGQQRAEAQAGMTDEPMREWASGEDWLKSAEEVLPSVLMLTGVMSGAGYGYRKIRDTGKEIDTTGTEPGAIRNKVLGAFGMREKTGGAMTTGSQAVTDIGAPPGPTVPPGGPAAGPGAPPIAPAPPQPMGATITGVDDLGGGREAPEERTKIDLERDLLAPIAPAGAASPTAPPRMEPPPGAEIQRSMPVSPERAEAPKAAREMPVQPPAAEAPAPVVDVFRRMPDDALRQQAELGVSGARTELARRAAELQAAGPNVSPVPEATPPSPPVQPSGAPAPAPEGPTITPPLRPEPTGERKPSRRQILDDAVAKYRDEGHEINDHGVYTNLEKIVVPFSKAAGRDGEIQIAEAPDGFHLGINIGKKYGDYEGSGYAPSIDTEAYGTRDEAISAGIKIIRNRTKADDPKGQRALKDLESFEKSIGGPALKEKISDTIDRLRNQSSDLSKEQGRKPEERARLESFRNEIDAAQFPGELGPSINRISVDVSKIPDAQVDVYYRRIKSVYDQYGEIDTSGWSDETPKSIKRNIIRGFVEANETDTGVMQEVFGKTPTPEPTATQGVETLGARPTDGLKDYPELTTPAPVVVVDNAPSGGWTEADKVPKQKQPWEMTRDEWLAGVRFYRSGKTKNAQVPGGERVILTQDSTMTNYKEKSRGFLRTVRRQAVSKAIKEGMVVPPEVLADFPELDPQTGIHKDVLKKAEIGKVPAATQGVETLGAKPRETKQEGGVDRGVQIEGKGEAEGQREGEAQGQTEEEKIVAGRGKLPQGVATLGARPKVAAVAGNLSDFGLNVNETTTKKGTPVWNVAGNTKAHIDAMKKAGGRWYGPKKVWSFYDGDPTDKLLTALGGKKEAEPSATGNLPPNITQEQMQTIRARLAVLKGYGAPTAGYDDWVKGIESGNAEEIANEPDYKSTLNAINLSIARYQGRKEPEAATKSKDIPVPFAKGEEVIVRYGGQTFPATVTSEGGVNWVHVAPKLSVALASKMRLPASLQVGVGQVEKAPEKVETPPPAKQRSTARGESIGINAEGEEVFEDANGVRSIVENGVRLTEPVAMVPTRGGVQAQPSTPRDDRYQVLSATAREALGERLTPYDAPEIIAAREKARNIPATILIDTDERKAFRQRLADEYYGDGAANKNRRVDLVVGMPGSGKSSRLAEPLAEQYGSLLIDSDEIKKRLPEYQNGIGAHATHAESALIADDMVTTMAARNGDNMVLVRLGKTLETMQTLIQTLNMLGYEIHLHYMDTTPDEAAKRAVTRFQETVRFVDPDYVLNTVDTRPREVYNQIKEMEEVSSYEGYDNNVPKGTDPRLYESKVHSDKGPGGRALHQVRRDSAEYAETAAGRETEAEPAVTPPAYGSQNKLVTKDELEEARKILREALSGIHMGVPLSPQVVQAGIKIAVYHVEAGSRAFTAYARKMIADFGDAVRPYLKQFYMAAKYQPGLDPTGMDNEATLDEIDENVVTLEDKQALIGKLQKGDQVYYKTPGEKGISAGEFVWNNDNAYVIVLSGGGLTREVPPENIVRAERDGKIIDIAEKEAILEPTEGGEAGETHVEREQSGPGMGRPSGLDAGEPPATDVRPVSEGKAPGLPGQEVRPSEHHVGAAGEREENAELAGPGDRLQRPDLPARRPGESGEPPSASVRKEAEHDRDLAHKANRAERDHDRNHRIGPTDTLFQSGKIARIEANIRAIILSKKLQKENRDATRAEMKILAQYTGWGAVTEEVFKDEYVRAIDYEKDGGWWWDRMAEKEKAAYLKWKKRIGEKLHPDLGGILTEEEWEAARESGLNAHFTSREVIDHGLWALSHRLGFKSGTVLEPAAGVGHILGLVPEEIASDVRLKGVELDNLTGNILTQLYPDAEIQVAGFEEARGMADNTVDLVISNFPFGKYEIFDKQHPDYSGWSIHNYFFARSLDVVRPGGLVVAITSHWTMDATTNGEVRKYLAKKADLIGAIRLPNTAFAANAGTEVVTDILILRKKTGEILSGADEWRLVMPTQTESGEEVSINEYFIRHPEMILGKNSTAGTMYGGNEYTVDPDLSTPLTEQLDAAVARFPAGLAGEAAPHAVRTEEEGELAREAEREGMLVSSPKGIFRVEGGRLVKPSWSNDAKKVKQARAYLKVKEQMKRVEAVMLDPDATDDDIATEQASLNRDYDAYVKAYGTITPARKSHLADDIEFPHAMALEREVREPRPSKGKTSGQAWSIRYEKMDIFSKRTLYPFVEPASAATLEDALNISLTYRNHLNMDLVAKLLGEMDADRLRQDILDRKLAFENPASGLLEMPGEYLSGNVREKLRIAEEKGHAVNAEALRQVQPKELTIDEIYVKLGSQWVPPDVIKGFLVHLGYSGYNTKVDFANTIIGEDGRSSWSVSTNYAQLPQWDTARVSASELVTDTLNLKMTQVYDIVRDEDNNEHRVLNGEQTAAAQEKQRQLNDAFKDYILRTPEVAKQLGDIYNREKNNYVDRVWEVPTLDHYPGASATIRLDDHQKRGVARGLQGSTVYAHAVGTGKTYLYSTLAMELRRTGQARKPLIVVQNSTLNQFAAQARQLYPAAKILCPTKADRQQANRQRLISQIATGEWDFVILPHSFFDSISVKPERERAFLQEQIDIIRQLLLAENEGRRRSGRKSLKVKQLEALLRQKEARMKALLDQRQDSHMALEDMGLDAMLVDEAHHYKRGEFFTQMGNIKGIDRGAAAKSFRFLMKCRVIQERTGFKNIYLATGTPVSNTTAELWTLLRYIRPDLLEAFGASSFDAFATSFGETSYELEPTPTGEFARVARFNKYVNGPEMLRMWKAAADVILQDEVPRWKGAVPKLRGGEVQQIILPRSDMLANFVMAVRAARAEWNELPGDEKREMTHIPLMLYNWAKFAAIDMRLVVAGAPDVAVSKVNRCVKEVRKRWADTADNRGTQLIFCDTINGPNGFNLYQDIKKKLVAKGLPANEIAIITDSKYNSDVAREALFEQVNEGTIRVVLGSSFKLGTGVNVQERLSAIHHIDAPVRPMDFEQRNGRIIRPGNTNVEVEILAYATENSLDALAYSVLQKKQKFVNQLLRGDLPGRMFDDPADELQFAFEDLAAAAMGNPLFKLRYDLEGRLRELTMLRAAHRENIGTIRNRIWSNESWLKDSKVKIAGYARLADAEKKAFPDAKITQLTLDGKNLDLQEGEKALKERMDAERAAVEGAVGAYLAEAEASKEKPQMRGHKSHLEDVTSLIWNSTAREAWSGANPKLRQIVERINAIQREIQFQVNGQDVKIQILPQIETETLEDLTQKTSPAVDLMTVAEIGGGVATAKRSVSGILTDLEKHIEATIQRPEVIQRDIEQTQKDLEAKRAELEKPFPKEEELNAVQGQLSETIRTLEATAAETGEGLDEEVRNRIDAWAEAMVRGSRPAMASHYPRRPERLERPVTLSRVETPDAVAVAEAVTAPVSPDLDELRKTVAEKWKGQTDETELDDDGEREEYSEWRAAQARAQAILSAHGEGSIEDAQAGLDQARLIWSQMDHPEGEEENYPPIFNSAQRIITAVRLGQGRLFEGDYYSTERVETRASSLSSRGIDDLVGGLTKAVKGLVARRTEDGRWVVRTKNGQAVEIVAVNKIAPNKIEMAILERDWGVKYDTAAMKGRRIAGAYTPETKRVRLVKNVAGSYTITHEFEHFLEDIGAITSADIRVLKQKINSLYKAGRLGFEPALADQVGGPEDRAKWIARQITGAYDAKTPTGRILQKIREIINRIVNALGLRTAAGVVRDIRTGKVFDRVQPTGAIAGDEEGRGEEKYMVAAWHGSPHTFASFDTGKIGTGEGAQAYGHGLYFAGKREVAEYYKEMLGQGGKITINGKPLEANGNTFLSALAVDMAQATVLTSYTKAKQIAQIYIDSAIDRLENNLPFTGTKEEQKEALEYLKSIGKVETMEREDVGRLYKVELAPEEDELLDWDMPLRKQSEKVKKALAPARTDEFDLNPEDGTDIEEGKTAYSRIMDALGSAKAASDYLHALGIRGIKYLDAASRGKGEGNHNYVIFAHEDVQIKEMYSMEGQGTPAFRRWFEGSKVVDDAGRPRVMYHGTSKAFTAFDKKAVGSNFGLDKAGFFFTNDPYQASEFAVGEAAVVLGKAPRKGANVLPVYVKIQNPFTLEDFQDRTTVNVFKQMEENMDSLTDLYDTYRGRIMRGAKEMRADGILFEYGHEVLAVPFDPTQIKSATGNRGTFDAANPDVRYSLEELPADTAKRIGEFTLELPDETKAKAAAADTKPAIRTQAKRPSGPSGPVGSQAEELWQAAIGPATSAVNRGVASLGARRVSPESQKGLTRLKQHWKEFWAPFSTVPQGKRALAARYKAMGDIAQAVRFLEGLHEQLDAYPPEIKKEMFQYLDGQVPLETLPEDARPMAESIRQRTRQIGLALVERGILAEGQFNKYEGRYIHYLYARHILGDDAEIGLTGTGKLDLSYTLRRNPKLTMEQRRELGLIEDASIAVPIGMGKALTDIAKWDYLAAIAENPDWVWQPSVVKVPVGKPLAHPVNGRTRRYVTMGIGKLAKETEIYAEMAAKHPSAEVEEHYRILRAALERAEAATENMPPDFKQLPNDKHYGKLAGAFVRTPIADDLMPILSLSSDKGKLFNAMIEIHGQGMAIFKIGKVAINFPTAFRNIISNIIQNNMRGRPLPKIVGDIVSALESMKAGDAYYEEAFKSGMFKTNWFAAEINDVLEQFRKVGTKDAIWTRALLAIKNVAKYYGKIDDVSKFAIYKQMRKDGADHAEALLEAMKWGMDYSLASRSIKGARQTVLPFATYQYKIAPLIAESLAKRPWVIGKYLAVWPLMKALAQGMNDLDDDDWDDLMKQLPSYVKQTGSVMILPWKSGKGQWQWINLEYFFPWGNYLGMFRDLRDTDIGEFTRDAGISNPFIDVLRIAQSARGEDPPEHPYTGQPIWNRLDSAPVKAGKFVEALANVWTPAMLTRQGAIGHTGKALIGGEDRWGREVTAGQALGRWFGLNITAVSPEQTAAQASVKIQDLKKELSRVKADQRYDDEEKAEREERMREKIAEIGREAPVSVLPILKDKGKDPVHDALLAMVEEGSLRSGPPSRTVEIGGTPYRMTLPQYQAYLEQSSRTARPRLQKLFESAGWQAMSAERKGQVVASIITNARKAARQKIKAEIARENRAKGATVAARG